jgi:hypothetical protein
MTDTTQESVQDKIPSPSDPLEQRLNQFLESWHAAQSNKSDDALPLEQRLNVFIEQWKATYTTPAASDATSVAPVDWSLRLEPLESFLQSFEPVRADIAKRRRMGRDINIWADAGIGREEVRNSKILAWLFDYHGSHGQQAGILKSILQRIGQLDRIYPALFDEPYSTSVEECPLEDRTNRVDIAISSNKALLYFEIKIDAKESNGQLTRYLTIANEAAGGRPWHVVYLTPNKTSAASVIGHPRFTHIRWLDLAAAIGGYSSKLDEESYAQRILSQYAEHVKSF